MTVGERIAEIRAMDDDGREEHADELDSLERLARQSLFGCGAYLIPPSLFEWHIRDTLLGGRRSLPPHYDYEEAASDYRAFFRRVTVGNETYWTHKQKD